MTTINDWVMKTFINPHLRGCAVGLAYRAFKAGQRSATVGNELAVENQTFEEWMLEEQWANSESP